MKIKLILLSILYILLMSSCQNKQDTVNTEKQKAEFVKETNKETFSHKALEQKFVTINTDTLSLRDIIKQNQKKTLIKVWASWCPDCIKDLPKLQTLQLNHPEIDYIFLSYDKNQEAWKKAIEKHQIKGKHYFILSDWKTGEFRKEIALDWIPRYILTDAEGNILLFKVIEADDPEIINMITENK